MKLALILRTATVLAAAALPLSVSAQVTQFDFVSGMSGANEVPSNASAGVVTINTLSFDDSVGSFGTLTVNLSYSGLTGTASAAHIHGFAAVGVNAGVVQALTQTGGTSGTISGFWEPTSALQVTDLFNGLTYVNLHSTSFAGGELRGQLTPVPEPSTYSFIAGALALTAVAVRRRKVKSV